ncbi:MAG: hypothetical protein ABMA13_18405 [Chthoniobacteraceae bacterium]
MTLNSEGIDALFMDLAQLTGKKPGRLVRERSGAVARYFAEATYPRGKDLAAKQEGQAAVWRDVGSVYIGPSSTYKYLVNEHGRKVAGAFYAKLKNGDLAGARAMLQKLGLSAGRLSLMEWDDGALHRKMRNSRGRVNRGVKPVIVSDAKSLKAYFKKIVKRVGWAKSGWITAARAIPGAKIGALPVWMKQPAPGRGIDRTQGADDPHVALFNDVKYLDDLVPQRAIDGAQDDFEKSLLKEIEKVTEYLRRKHAA